MNIKALKYLLVLTPLCVWFYFGCASSKPAASSGVDGDAVLRIQQAAEERVMRRDSTDHVAAIPRDTSRPRLRPLTDSIAADSTLTAELPETLTDSLSLPEDISDSLYIANIGLRKDSVAHVLKGIDAREEALERFTERYAYYHELFHEEGIPHEEMNAHLLDSLAPMLDTLRTAGVVIPTDEQFRKDISDLAFIFAEMISYANSAIGRDRESAGIALTDIAAADTVRLAEIPRVRPPRRDFLDAPIKGTNQDSMVYDVSNKMVYIYQQGNIDYQDMNLQGDYIRFNTETRDITAQGVLTDSARTRPKFTQKGDEINMDSIVYNMRTRKSLIWGIDRAEGDGFMLGDRVKMHPDNHFDMAGGKYTTCNHTDCPHFYIAMNKGKVIPNKKVIFGMAHFVLEDVPLYFPFVPFGFFPLASGPSSGFIMPSFGEDAVKGFFLRDGGYYFRFNDYMDANITGSIYTLGSWSAGLQTHYMKRYKYQGSLNFRYSQDVLGEKNSKDYVNSGNYSLTWNHTQDAKFRPNSSFSASVNISSSGFNKYSTTSVAENLNTQTSSSISYSKTFPAGQGWFPGGNLTMSFRHSQNSRDSTISFTFPDANWSIQKFKPLQRRNRIGKERWYEKLTIGYSGKMVGSVDTKEKELFTESTIDKLKMGVQHTIPLSLSLNMLGYINFTPSANYNERWYFKKENREWDPVNKEVISDTTMGFYRVYDYSASASMSTKIYGMYQFKNPTGLVRAIRHVVTPSVSFSIKPDFRDPKFGYYKTYQTNEDGSTQTYSPYHLGTYGVPSGGESASISFSLQQNLEAKVRSDRDTTGVRKIKIIDNLSLSGSYNLIADSMGLSNISFNFRTPIVDQFTLQFSGSLDPYAYDPVAKKRYNKLVFAQGKLPRVVSFNTSFSYQWQKTLGSQTEIEQYNAARDAAMDMLLRNEDPDNPADPETIRRLMTSAYYDFSIPFNFSFSYTLNYSNNATNNGLVKKLDQSFNFDTSITLTPYKASGTNRWALRFGAGYNVREKKLTPGTVSIVRDLHCFTMSLNWVPIGMLQSWSFNIRIKSDVLKDIKYDKRRSQYESMYD